MRACQLPACKRLQPPRHLSAAGLYVNPCHRSSSSWPPPPKPFTPFHCQLTTSRYEMILCPAAPKQFLIQHRTLCSPHPPQEILSGSRTDHLLDTLRARRRAGERSFAIGRLRFVDAFTIFNSTGVGLCIFWIHILQYNRNLPTDIFSRE